jgi:hypothetical protein
MRLLPFAVVACLVCLLMVVYLVATTAPFLSRGVAGPARPARPAGAEGWWHLQSTVLIGLRTGWVPNRQGWGGQGSKGHPAGGGGKGPTVVG